MLMVFILGSRNSETVFMEASHDGLSYSLEKVPLDIKLTYEVLGKLGKEGRKEGKKERKKERKLLVTADCNHCVCVHLSQPDTHTHIHNMILECGYWLQTKPDLWLLVA